MKLKRGVTREDGKIFWLMKNDREYWITKEQYLRFNELNRKKAAKRKKENPQAIKEISKKWRKNNRKKINDYNNRRRRSDPLYRMRHQVSTTIRESFRVMGFVKNSSAEKILCCSFEQFKKHIESQFLQGMSWENRCLWHLDHIMPVSMAKTPDEILRLNHYRNFRPMWAADNIRKSNKTPETLVLF